MHTSLAQAMHKFACQRRIRIRTYTEQMHAEESNGIYVCVQSVTRYCWRKTSQPAMKGASNS